MKALLLSAVLLACLLGQQPAPRVISAAKGWSIGTTPVNRGDTLPVTAEITGRTATDLVLDCGSSGWIAYTCSKPPCRVHACAKKIDGMVVQRVDPDARNNVDARPSMGEMLMSFFRHQPKAPETLGVRSGGNPNDAVVALQPGGIDLAPALARVLEGKYCFRLTPLPSGPGATFVLDWDRERLGSALARVAGSKPGAYTIDKSASEVCTFTVDQPGLTAWVVIVPDADFSRLDALWKSYQPWFRQLDQTGTTPEILATVRHAVLSSLADMVEKK
jgi:hypothetical protein